MYYNKEEAKIVVGDDMKEYMFYLIDIAALLVVLKLVLNSMKIKVESDFGSNKIVTGIFVTFAVVIFFTGSGIVNVVQCIVVFIIGLAYLNIRNGFMENGIVLMGRLYKKEKLKNVDVEKDGESYRVSFTYKRKTHFLYCTKENIVEAKQIIKSLQTN